MFLCRNEYFNKEIYGNKENERRGHEEILGFKKKEERAFTIIGEGNAEGIQGTDGYGSQTFCGAMMNELSLFAINEKAPYHVLKGELVGSFRFFTDNIDEFFKKNQSTLLYICEMGDGKQSMRSRLFEHWFNSYDRKMLFTLLTTSIVDEEGELNFATLIIRNDNPKLSEIIMEFSESVKLLSQKPE